MTEAAIISGSLVDVRNVGTHKSVKLTIHVPEELAMKVMEAFGWPTGVSPIEVAIVRLDQSASRQPPPAVENKPGPAPQPPVPEPVWADKERRRFDEMPPAQQAGIFCGEPAFKIFLAERLPRQWAETLYDPAATIRFICNVDSRRDITPDNAMWSALVLSYRLWQREPEFVG